MTEQTKIYKVTHREHYGTHATCSYTRRAVKVDGIYYELGQPLKNVVHAEAEDEDVADELMSDEAFENLGKQLEQALAEHTREHNRRLFEDNEMLRHKYGEKEKEEENKNADIRI